MQDAISLRGVSDENQPSFWNDRVRLDEGFWRSLRTHPVPVREESIRAIGTRSLAIDVYIWLAYRLHALAKSTPVSWTAIHAQFGAGFRHVRQIKPTFTEALSLALAVYPEARVDMRPHRADAASVAAGGAEGAGAAAGRSLSVQTLRTLLTPARRPACGDGVSMASALCWTGLFRSAGRMSAHHERPSRPVHPDHADESSLSLCWRRRRCMAAPRPWGVADMAAWTPEALLAPVSEAEPCGPNLEFDQDYGALARAAEGKPERQSGSAVIPAEDPDWREVETLAAALLERTRDLRVLAQLGDRAPAPRRAARLCRGARR